MAVPTVFLNGEVFGQGRMSWKRDRRQARHRRRRARGRQARAKDAFDVLIVGGGPAGAAAAIYAARKGIRTGVAAERFGGQVLTRWRIENFISVLETDGPKLAAALEATCASTTWTS
jgi:alkyl hydroperoxide reductase subunit F